MGADIPNAKPMRSVYITIRVDTPERAEQAYFYAVGKNFFRKSLWHVTG